MTLGKLAFAWNELKGKRSDIETLKPFQHEVVENIHAFQSSHPQYTETPLVSLKKLAKYINVHSIFVKDESKRFGLNAFKVLGGIYVVGRYIAEFLEKDFSELTIEELTSDEFKRQTGELTFASATDGNHGRGIAWAARELGHKAVIYLPKGAAQERVEAIEREGARAVVTEGNYDESVRLVAKHAKEKGWIVVQDTAWEGYEEIPHWIMQGYATLTKEIVEQIGETKPTHVFLQAGVGSYAASIVASMVNYYGDMAPKFVLAEPHGANCFYLSFKASEDAFKIVEGDLRTIMAGLSCGEPNPKAWDILKNHIDLSVSCDDQVAALGMRVLASPLPGDEQIISGESGAVTTGLLYTLMTDSAYVAVREKLGLNEQSKVVLISTEGDTDQKHYREVVWGGRHPYDL